MTEEAMMSKSNRSSKVRGRRKSQRGIALITTLLLLLLMTALSLAMVISVRSDLLVNGYYRNSRGSFYAADSGINVVRQAMINGVVGDIPATIPTTVPATAPLPANAAATVLNAVTTKYPPGTVVPVTGSGQGQAANSWPESFTLDSATLTSTCVTDDLPSTCTAPSVKVSKFTYVFTYSMTSSGQSGAQYGSTQATKLTENGQFTFSATFVPATTPANFAGWGMFIDSQPICSGTLVQGTITGPVFTNGAWNFGTGNTGYTFTDPVGSVSPQFGYQIGGGCDRLATPTDTNGGSTIAPKFQAGYNLSTKKIDLPTDTYDQLQAVLDGKGKASGKSPDLSALQKANGSGNYSPGTGVFLPYSTTGGVNTFNGGGLYVEGDASIVLTPSGSAAQIYTITQSTGTTTVTIDPTDGGTDQTTVVSGGKKTFIVGVPMQLDPLLPLKPETMLYVKGNVTGLVGPHDNKGNSLGPAINDHTALTVTATGDITVTGDLKYVHEPVTMSATQIAGLGLDAIIPNTTVPLSDTGQALGIFTPGNVQLKNAQPSTNLEIDASIATLAAGGSGAIINTGSAIGNLNIVGGRIQNTIQNIGASTRNVFFDRRFAGTFSPPWFPSTTITNTGSTAPVPTRPQVTRTQWLNKTSTFD